jgi:hypothetical protein
MKISNDGVVSGHVEPPAPGCPARRRIGRAFCLRTPSVSGSDCEDTSASPLRMRATRRRMPRRAALVSQELCTPRPFQADVIDQVRSLSEALEGA